MAKTQKTATAQQTAAVQERGYAPLQYDVKIHSLYPEGSCRASASVNLNGSFAIRGLKVMEGIVPHIWKNGNDFAWYVYQPTAADYKTLADAVGSYTSMFQGEDLSQGMGSMTN